MTMIFFKLLQMSMTASWLIVAVILLQFFLKKIPRNFRCILWAIVGFRLLCPFSIESVVGLIPNNSYENTFIENDSITQLPNYTPIITDKPHTDNNLSQDNSSDHLSTNDSTTPITNNKIDYEVDIPTFLTIVWMIGIFVLLLYSFVSTKRLYQCVYASILLHDNVLICDHISTPFILGVIKPKIYLPSNLSATQMKCILSHEQTHLQRHDHWWKPLGFVILTIHWFNPLVWISYLLFCRDIELACDEAVIHNMIYEDKKTYLEVLVSCSILQRKNFLSPLAFGETGIKERVKFMANYKKPTLLMILFTIIICSVVVACFGTSKPSTPTESTTETEETIFALEELESETIQKVASITTTNVQLEDLEILETARTELRNALRALRLNNYNAEKEEVLTNEINRLNQVIKIITQVQLVQDHINRLPESPNIGKETYIEKIELIELAYDSLSEYGKTLLDDSYLIRFHEFCDLFDDYTLTSIKVGYYTESNIWYLNGNESQMSFSVKGAASKHNAVHIDGVRLRYTTDYNRNSYNDTTITIHKRYLNTLSIGEHTITILFDDGEVTATFYVTDEWIDTTKPKPEGSYEYPIQTGTDKWINASLGERYEAGKISQDILDHMTNEQLVQAIVDYPMLFYYCSSSRRATQVANMEEHCNAYAELLSRDLEQAKNEYIAYMQKYCVPVDEAVVDDDIQKNSYLVTLILCQEKFKAILTEEDKAIIQIYNRFHGEIV